MFGNPTYRDLTKADHRLEGRNFLEPASRGKPIDAPATVGLEFRPILWGQHRQSIARSTNSVPRSLQHCIAARRMDNPLAPEEYVFRSGEHAHSDH